MTLKTWRARKEQARDTMTSPIVDNRAKIMTPFSQLSNELDYRLCRTGKDSMLADRGEDGAGREPNGRCSASLLKWSTIS